jgi:hypothetical protein
MHLSEEQEVTMKPDRPLILSILCLIGGFCLTLWYCQGSAGLSAGFPVSSSTIHFSVTTSGPAALGGIVLTAVGVLLLLWALLVAVFGQLAQIAGSDKGPERLFE